MSSLGFGIIGCGVIAPTHASAIARLPGARLVAVADPVAERARALAGEHGVDWHTDPADLLARPDVDAVCICTPSGHHAELGVQAARAGKHVVVEKPIEITLEAADRLIAACREAGVRLTVISQHRHDGGVRRLRELIDEGRLGRLVLGDAVVKWYRTQGYYDSGDWRGTPEVDGGGALMNQGVHYVDLLQWLMGPVERVVARCATATHDIRVEDVALALLTFRSGALGVIEVSTSVFPGLPERIEISGTGGTAIVEAGALVLAELKEERGETSAYGAKAQKAEGAAGPSTSADPAAVTAGAHQAQLQDFVDAIRDGRDPAITGEEARRPLEIILAVYESARTGREVLLPPAPATAPVG